jgi:hypothetical protein
MVELLYKLNLMIKVKRYFCSIVNIFLILDYQLLTVLFLQRRNFQSVKIQ